MATLGEGHRRLAELLARLSDDALVRPATIGGGDWSAKDLIGHIAAWEEVAVDALAEWRRGEMPRVELPEGPMSGSGQVDAFNERAVEEKRGVGLEGVVQGAHVIHQKLVEAIEGLSDQEWLSKYLVPYVRERLLATLLGYLTSYPDRLFGIAFVLHT